MWIARRSRPSAVGTCLQAIPFDCAQARSNREQARSYCMITECLHADASGILLGGNEPAVSVGRIFDLVSPVAAGSSELQVRESGEEGMSEGFGGRSVSGCRQATALQTTDGRKCPTVGLASAASRGDQTLLDVLQFPIAPSRESVRPESGHRRCSCHARKARATADDNHIRSSAQKLNELDNDHVVSEGSTDWATEPSGLARVGMKSPSANTSRTLS